MFAAAALVAAARVLDPPPSLPPGCDQNPSQPMETIFLQCALNAECSKFNLTYLIKIKLFSRRYIFALSSLQARRAQGELVLPPAHQGEVPEKAYRMLNRKPTATAGWFSAVLKWTVRLEHFQKI